MRILTNKKEYVKTCVASIQVGLILALI